MRVLEGLSTLCLVKGNLAGAKVEEAGLAKVHVPRPSRERE